MNFAERLKQLRNNKHISQRELAEDLNVGSGTVAMWEMGHRVPKLEKLEEIADYFNVNMGYLMGEEDKSTYYINPEAEEIAQELFDRPELKVLFKASRDLSKEDVEFVVDMIERMNK